MLADVSWDNLNRDNQLLYRSTITTVRVRGMLEKISTDVREWVGWVLYWVRRLGWVGWSIEIATTAGCSHFGNVISHVWPEHT